jgi:hypothetical protein
MTAKSTPTVIQRWTASELRKVPHEERETVLETAAALAEDDYCNDNGLTAFEAFGRDETFLTQSPLDSTLVPQSLRSPSARPR